jgi:hypothetical protein
MKTLGKELNLTSIAVQTLQNLCSNFAFLRVANNQGCHIQNPLLRHDPNRWTKVVQLMAQKISTSMDLPFPPWLGVYYIEHDQGCIQPFLMQNFQTASNNN